MEVSKLVAAVKANPTVENLAALNRVTGDEKNKEAIIQYGGVDYVVEALNHRSSNAVAAQCLQVLLALSYQNASRCDVIAKAGTIDAVLALVEQCDTAQLLSECFQLLVNLTVELESNRVFIGSIGGISLICRCAAQYVSDSGVLWQFARLVTNLAFKLEENQKAFFTAGGLDILLQAMRAYPEDEDLQTDCCSAIANFTCRSQLPALAPAIPVLIAGLNRDSSARQKQAMCRALVTVALDKSNQEAVATTAGIQAIIRCMGEHPDESAIQLECFRALANITGEEAVCATVISAGGLATALEAMERQASNGDIMALVSRLFSNLLRDAAAFSIVNEDAAARLVLGIIDKHTSHVSAMQLVCGALGKMSAIERMRQPLVRAHALQALLRVMKTHGKHVGVMERCLDACSTLVSAGGSAQSVAMECGLLGALMPLMQQFETQRNVLNGCLLLSGHLLRDNDKARMALGSTEFLKIVTKVMEAHQNVAPIIGNGCTVIGNLCNDTLRDRVCDAGLQFVVKATQSHISNSTVVLAALASLIELATKSATNQARIVSDAAPVVLGALKHHIDNESVQLRCLALLALVSGTEELQRQLGNFNAVMRVIGSMVHYASGPKANREIMLNCLALVVALSSCEDNILFITADDGLKMLVQLARSNPYELIVQTRTCQILSNLARLDEVREYVGQEGGVTVMLDVLRHFPSGAEVLVIGCWTLEKYILKHADNQSRALEGGVVRLVTDALVNNPTHADLATKVFRLLLAISSQVIACSQFVEAEGLQLLCKTVTRHTADIEVVKSALGFLASLVTIKAQNRFHTSAVEAGIPSTVVSATQAHLSNVAVAQRGVRVLLALAKEEPTHKAILHAGAMALIASAMTKHPDAHDLQIVCCALIQLVTEDNEDAQLVVGQSGATKACVQTLRTHLTHFAVCSQACGALSNLVGHPFNQTILIELNVIGIVLDAMRHRFERPASAASSEAGSSGMVQLLELLGLLCQDSTRNKDVCHEQSGCQLVAQCARKYNSDAEAQEMAALAIAYLAQDHPRNRLLFTGPEVKAIALLLDALRRHFPNPSVLAAGLYALAMLLADNTVGLQELIDAEGLELLLRILQLGTANLMARTLALTALLVTENRQCRGKLLAEGGLAKVLAIMKAYPQNSTVQENGCRIFSALASIGDTPVKELLESEALSVACTAVAKHSNTLSVLDAVAGLLQLLSSARDACNRFIQAGVPTAIAGIVGHSGPRVEVAARALAVLAHMASTDSCDVRVLLAEGLIPAIARLLSARPPHTAVASHGCVLIGYFGANATTRRLVEGLVPAVLSLAAAATGDADGMVGWALCGLLSTSGESPFRKDVLNGPGKRLVDACSSTPFIQESAFRLDIVQRAQAGGAATTVSMSKVTKRSREGTSSRQELKSKDERLTLLRTLCAFQERGRMAEEEQYTVLNTLATEGKGFLAAGRAAREENSRVKSLQEEHRKVMQGLEREHNRKLKEIQLLVAATVEELQTKLFAAQQQLSHHVNRADKSHAEMEEMRHKLAQEREEWEQTKIAEKAAIQASRDGMSRELEEFEKRRKSIKVEEEDWEEKKEQMAREMEEYEPRLSSLKIREEDVAQQEEECAKIRAREAELGKYERDLCERERVDEERVQEWQKRAAELAPREESCAKREKEIKRREKLLAERERDLEEDEKEFDEREKQLKEQERKLKDRKNELRAAEDALASNQKQLDQRRMELADLEQSWEPRKKDIELREQRMATREKDVDEKGKQLARRENDLANKEQALEEREQDVEAQDMSVQTRDLALEKKENEYRKREADLRRWEEQVNQRDVQLETREMELNRREEEIDEKERTFGDRIADLGKREAACDDRELEVAERHRALHDAKAERDRLQAQITAQMQELTWAQQEFKKVETEFSQREAEAMQRDSRLNEREEKLNKLQLRLDRLRGELHQRDAELERIEERFSERERKLKDIEAKLKSQEFALAAGRREVDELDQKRASLAQFETSLIRKEDELETKVHELQERESRLEELETQSASRSVQIDGREARIDEKEADLEHQQSALEQREVELRREQHRLSTEWQRLREKEEDLDSRETQLQKRTEGKKKQLSAAERDLQTKEDDLRDLERRVEEAELEVQAKQEQAAKQQAAIQQLQEAVATERRATEAQAQQLLHQQQTVSALQQDVERANKELALRHADVRRMEVELYKRDEMLKEKERETEEKLRKEMARYQHIYADREAQLSDEVERRVRLAEQKFRFEHEAEGGSPVMNAQLPHLSSFGPTFPSFGPGFGSNVDSDELDDTIGGGDDDSSVGPEELRKRLRAARQALVQRREAALQAQQQLARLQLDQKAQERVAEYGEMEEPDARLRRQIEEENEHRLLSIAGMINGMVRGKRQGDSDDDLADPWDVVTKAFERYQAQTAAQISELTERAQGLEAQLRPLRIMRCPHCEGVVDNTAIAGSISGASASFSFGNGRPPSRSPQLQAVSNLSGFLNSRSPRAVIAGLKTKDGLEALRSSNSSPSTPLSARSENDREEDGPESPMAGEMASGDPILLQNPKRIRVEGIKSTSVVVRWTQPLNAVGAVEYTVLVSPNAGESYCTAGVTTERSFKLADLSPNTVYFAAVMTRNDLKPPPHWKIMVASFRTMVDEQAAADQASQPVRVIELEQQFLTISEAPLPSNKREAPLPPHPSNIKVVNITSRSATVRWRPPPVAPAAGNLQFRIYLGLPNDASAAHRCVGLTSNPTFNLTELCHGTAYSVSVGTVVNGRENASSRPTANFATEDADDEEEDSPNGL
eukprot:TRINITY_DN6523_c0_g1_i1.p1 TRINITY_DN6523_c0_g1~~TRINITY_DN6523_c0_g1_i1.p1  ORF type:complete len:2792 (-),score=570.93 TRINITY_DN6523_c0_g1_i1:1102-9477(-)